ncbi:MAG: HAMP domain-containing histidine kinase, partial [Myxococcota bacterium]|nr:HAMP domain-containing histidine kinase [Myxococcota bacterium]
MRTDRRPFQVGAAIIAIGGAASAVGSSNPHAILGIHLLWAGSILLFGQLQGTRIGESTWVRASAALISPVLCAAVVPLTGGLGSMAMYGVPAIPLLQASFLRGNVLAATVGALGSLFSGVAIAAVLLDSQRAQHFILLLLALGLSAIQSARMYRRMDQVEGAAARQREQALVKEAEETRAAHEAELRWATSERLAAVGRMAAAVSHEINNPLAYVSANLLHLQRELASGLPADPAELQEVLQETQQGLEQIRQIAADLRVAAREESVPPSSFALGPVLEAAVRIAQVRAGKRVRIETRIPEELPQLFGMPGRLRQVFVNLLANAVDATCDQPRQEVRVWVHSDGERLLVSVEDTGVGLPEHWQARLFKPFFTTKSAEEGTGLGLSLSRRYVAESGGALWAEARAEGGARCCVALPLAVAPRPLAVAAPPPPAA